MSQVKISAPHCRPVHHCLKKKKGTGLKVFGACNCKNQMSFVEDLAIDSFRSELVHYEAPNSLLI